MTTEEAEALGKRIVACRHFRPMRGMLDMQGRTWDQSLLWRWDNNVDVPDLRDPATLGCLLALVREAWGDPTYLPTCLDPVDEAWIIEPPSRERQTRYGSYARVLVAALEAAP